MSTQAGLTVILASLAPVTAFMYVSGIDYQPAILFNGLMFATASMRAQRLPWREYRTLIRAIRHSLMLRAWLVIYVFVGIQMDGYFAPSSAIRIGRRNFSERIAGAMPTSSWSR